MKNSLSFGIFLLVILLSSSLFASGVGLTGIGARATALGGNFRGIADDWSAMYWNPAGITQIEGMQFGGGLEVLWPVASYLPAQYLHPIFQAPSKFSTLYYKKLEGTKWQTVENEPRTFFIPSMGFVLGLIFTPLPVANIPSRAAPLKHASKNISVFCVGCFPREV